MTHMNRRHFVARAGSGALAALLPVSALRAEAQSQRPGGLDRSPNREDVHATYTALDEILKKPVFRRELFAEPAIIDSVQLLRYKDSFLCRVRARNGAEGVSVGNGAQLSVLYPIFVDRIAPFFIGKDARDLESLLEEVTVYKSNYKAQGLAIWVPLATLEFAILDMFGRIAGKSIGQLIGEIHNPRVAVYQANGDRGISPQETIERLRRELAVSKAKAIKFKLGGRMSSPEQPAGRSESLIPLVRRTFGEDMVISADANGSYTVEEAVRIGRLMEESRYAFFEEPVPFDWYAETKQVADALRIPIAGGEQEPSLHNFRWLLANRVLAIVQPDMFYFGGMVRCMRVARMAHALGCTCVPHISSSGVGYLYMMHFVSAIPNAGPYHEFKAFNDDLPLHCATSTLRSDDRGEVTVPTGPGLGIEIDPGFIARHEIVKA
jgi:L-alanine-DL-glutamate epimerase-like enolase superfamily enzyme